jgi:hypothetical protein
LAGPAQRHRVDVFLAVHGPLTLATIGTVFASHREAKQG